ncbi:ankyrin repeat domain-containing protein [Variovorax paradoxus]|uniref:ankyrin repeat domain-containing protein n=1 Tax=Variovorax paradoxus TaxID=34073 RepID=UPI003D655C47
MNQQGPLIAAVVAGDKACATALLQSGASIHEKASPDLFLQAGMPDRGQARSADGVNAIGWQPLHVAAWLGHVEIASLLLSAGADSNASTPLNWRPVFAAAHQGHCPLLKLLVDHGADPEVLDEALGTPLEIASFHGHEDVVRFLLAWGADPNHARRNGRSPLIAAVIGGRDAVVRELIAFGANPVAGDDKQWTARMHAAWYARCDIAPILGRPGLSLHLADAAATGDLAQIGVRLAAGDLVDQLDGYGDSPLIWACRAGHLSAAERLLDAGASLRAVGVSGSPAEVAAQRGHLEVVEMLLARGVDPQIGLNAAVKAGHLNVVRLLVGAGARADGRALVAAVSAEQLESARLLIALGAPVNEQSTAGLTALHCAAYSGNIEMVELLLAQGADPSIIDQEGKTPAQIAEEEYWEELVAVLSARALPEDH